MHSVLLTFGSNFLAFRNSRKYAIKKFWILFYFPEMFICLAQAKLQSFNILVMVYVNKSLFYFYLITEALNPYLAITIDHKKVIYMLRK